MSIHSNALRQLAQQVLSISEQHKLLLVLISSPFSVDDMAAFDLSLGGPSMTRLDCRNSGRYDAKDRGVFRPLQYCCSYLEMADRVDQIEWLTRELVHMSGLHLETTLKRVGQTNMPWPLGKLLHNSTIQRKVNTQLRNQISQYLNIYNASKHDVNQPKDTHLFSLEDAVIAYTVSRKIGIQLYPLAKLATNTAMFDTSCPD